MNILMANWSWYPTGGDWTYIDSIIKIYEAKGHKVIPFSAHHEKNVVTPFETYFIKNIDYQKLNDNKSIKAGFEILAKTIYSFEAKAKIKLLLDNTKIDIVQFNSITNSITPSVIPVIKKRNIPMVWRILDYKLICPNAYLYTGNKVCEACIDQKFIHCVLKKCKKKSILASAAAAMGSYFYYFYPIYKHIEKFLFQSEFTRDIFVKFGYDIKKTHVVENPYDCKNIQPIYEGKKYILYFGRLEREKGICTLLQAMKNLPDIELKIVGSGTEYEMSKKYILDNRMTNVRILGPIWNAELEPIIEKCEFVVVPSEWYEPSPYVVLQSFSYGKPVLAAKIGGLNDLIINNETGLFFNAGDIHDLTAKIRYLHANKDLIKLMGHNARGILEKKHNPERYYSETINIFDKLINSRSKQ